ncbi:thioredoxin domain-containing protein [Thermoactinomyces mirandus]|uniref:DsbA family protein n=1 Tax=Thermoactinomyces mirandus TaxID=2756294 RepID=A0A7W1XR15_9BACL|nr:thioredoxin domain-containing protein [Thermoactinomyces mirandus]MBA4601664.1 DsbA family protein [Thermoactinomyces mirandus]
MANKHKKGKKNSLSTITMITILVFLIGFGVVAVYQSATNRQDKQTETARTYDIDYTGQPRIGDSNAPVKIMEFADFKCPVCKTFAETVYPRLKKEYIDTGKVQLYFNNYQFIGDDSITAGMAGESVYKQNSEAFWKFYETVLKNQKDETTAWATPEFLLQLIKKEIPEVDVEKVKEDLEKKTYLQEVMEDNSKAENLMIASVPTLVINGKKVENPLDYQALKQMIEEELKNSAK